MDVSSPQQQHHLPSWLRPGDPVGCQNFVPRGQQGCGSAARQRWAIFVTNIIVFGIWYWELDRGGPFARHAGERPYPDFMLLQMTTPHLAKPDWRPTFVDLYLTSSPA
jgi:hypothetical protein